MYKEGISDREFSAALESLKTFTKVDITGLLTAHDLSEVGSYVGRSLRIVTLALGEERDHQGTPVSDLVGDTRYLNRFNDQGNFSYLVVTTSIAGLIQRWNSQTPKNRLDSSYNDGHWVFFPTDLSLENPRVEAFLLRAGVGPVLKRYNLRRDLQPEAVQGYARVLQESLKDLIPTFTHPDGS